MEALQPPSIGTLSSSSSRPRLTKASSTTNTCSNFDGRPAGRVRRYIEMDSRVMSLRCTPAEPGHCEPHSRFCPSTQCPSNGATAARFRRSAEDFCRQPVSPDSVLSRSLSVDSSKALLMSFAGSRHQQQQQNHHHHQQQHTVTGGKPSRSFPLSLNSSPMIFRPSPAPASRWAGIEDDGMRPPPWLDSCGRSSKKILHKYLCFLRPIYRKVRRMNFGAKPVNTEGTPAAGRKRVAGVDKPPSGSGCRRVFDAGMENSIHEAVLHCKKSIGRNEK